MRPDLRGALIIAGPLIGAAGLVLVYIKGFLMNWRTVAWVCCAYAAIPLVLLTFFCPESPTWLVQKGRIDDAKAALKYFTARDECQRFKVRTTYCKFRALKSGEAQMKPTAAMLSPVFPKGIYWADHSGSGRGHHSLFCTVQGSTVNRRGGIVRAER